MKEGIIGYPTSPFKKSGPFPDIPGKCDGEGTVPETQGPQNQELSLSIAKNWERLAQKDCP